MTQPEPLKDKRYVVRTDEILGLKERINKLNKDNIVSELVYKNQVTKLIDEAFQDAAKNKEVDTK